MPTHTHYTKTYISLGGPGGGGGPLFPLVCGAGVGAGSTVRRAARPRRTSGGVDTITTYESVHGHLLLFETTAQCLAVDG